ncbi:unnamed protein product [Citrullus colocynthis]|uniref:Uncharacterized protein n=1 Tax=Citrullus colocynthis TaxID=252529 RepID=A0ABP0YLC4_9ROSI
MDLEILKIALLLTATMSEKLKGKCMNTSKAFTVTGMMENDEGGSEDSPKDSQASTFISSFERKVLRSKSVGCTNWSFSDNFFENHWFQRLYTTESGVS